jgi:predicted molibdopterin-dependent oxidoreductase YjgC
MNYKPGICTFCGTGCGHLMDVREGEVCGVYPLQNHPVSKGRLCVRGWNIHELLRTDEKIRTPLVRKSGTLVETTYKEAVGELVDKLSKHAKADAGGIGFLASPRSSNEENFLLMKLARSVFKTNNISLDSDPGHRRSLDVLYRSTGMAGMSGALEDISKANFILVAGIDITKQNPIIGSEIHKAGRAGARIVTFDTRSTQIARLSGRFLQIRPGSYKIAMAYMAKVLLDEFLADADFIKKHTSGYDGFAAVIRMLEETDVAEKTGVPVDDLREVARELSHADTAMVFFSSGISGFDQDTISYIYNLFLMSGKIGREGCGVNPITGINNLQGSYDMGIAPDLLTGFQPMSDPAVREKFNREWGVTLPTAPGRSIHELLSGGGKPKAMVVVEHDETIITNVDQIRAMDFVAYIGSFKNNFMDYAHVVLPIATYAEANGTYTNTGRRIQLSKKKIEPPRGVEPGWRLYSMIAERAGSKWGYGSSADVMDEIARLTPTYAGISHQRLEGTYGIKWPCNKEHPEGTDRFDLQGSSSPIPFAPVDSSFKVPEASDEYPILLLIGEAQHYWHQNNLMKKTNIPLREYNATLLLYPQGYVAVSPENAREIGVRDRSPVKIVSPYGSMEAMVQVTDKVAKNTAYVANFIHDMVTKFFLEHRDVLKRGEDATIPVRIMRV